MPILTDQERLGTTIGDGRYRLDRVLGRGGMGTVFEALHEWTGRRVAVKILREDVASDIDASQRFLQEARSATAIEHPNVVEVLDMGRHDEWTVYMVFELLRGQSLADRLDAVGRLDPMEAVMILLPVADAVAAAHRLGIVHRDLKPDNIFLEDDGMGYIRPKLLDFGIARPTERGREVRTGVIAGTPEYLSPEHAQGFRAGPASDVWSLGVVLFECITGNRPFEGDSVVSVLLAITSESIPSLRGSPYVPGPIAGVVEGALVRDPSFRIPDAEGFRNALAAAAQVDFVPSRSRSVAPKILRESREIALSRAHRVESRRSTPSLATMSSAGALTPAPPSAVATLDDVSQISIGLLDPERVPEPVRRRIHVTFAFLALLLVVFLVFGYRATQLASARDTDPAATNAELRSVATNPSPASDRGVRLAPEPGVASAGLSAEGSAHLPGTAAMASASVGSGITVTPPVPLEHRARRSRAGPRSAIQRGANGSLILD